MSLKINVFLSFKILIILFYYRNRNGFISVASISTWKVPSLKLSSIGTVNLFLKVSFMMVNLLNCYSLASLERSSLSTSPTAKKTYDSFKVCHSFIYQHFLLANNNRILYCTIFSFIDIFVQRVRNQTSRAVRFGGYVHNKIRREQRKLQWQENHWISAILKTKIVIQFF